MSQNATTSPQISPRIRKLVDLMDSKYQLPGTNFHFGADSLIGLVPGIGDFLGMAIGALVVFEAYRVGASWPVMGRMAFNLWLDAVLGSVPLVGDTFDFFFKANRRNLELLQRHLGGGSAT